MALLLGQASHPLFLFPEQPLQLQLSLLITAQLANLK